jgi:hypothetical protein
MKEQRREHFRVSYPLKCRPSLGLAGKDYAVIDVSERGVRFGGVHAGAFVVGQPVSFTIRFVDGDTLDFSGKIVRVHGRTVAIRLNDAIPLKKIRSEEVYVIKHFPLFRR